MPASTKARILDTAADLFRRQGFVATGLKQITAEAPAPFASIYHFFPGGKTELGAEVIRASGRMYMQIFVEIAAESPDVLSAVEEFFAGAAETLSETGYEDACPIATVALEVASTNETLREATSEVFEEWIDGASAYFVLAGIPQRRARELAFQILSLLEGAFIFCRAMRNTDALQAAGKCAVAAVSEALAECDAQPGAGGRGGSEHA